MVLPKGMDFRISNKKYKSLTKNPILIPKKLLNKTFKCKKCKTKNIPDWLEKHPPMTPAKCINGLWLVPVSSHFECSNCNSDIDINYPKFRMAPNFLLFADEAYRDFDKYYMVTYTFVGIPESKYLDLEISVKKWKSFISTINGGGHLDIAHWTDLWAADKRKKINGIENISKEDTIKVFNWISNGVFK